MVRTVKWALPCVCAIWLFASTPFSEFPSAAPAQVSAPDVAVSIWMPSKDFTLQEIKYRGLYNQFQTKAIPMPDFDFAANLRAELIDQFKKDTRAKWRASTAEEDKAFAAYFPAVKPDKVKLPDSVTCDRVLLITAAYGGVTHVSGDRYLLSATLRMVDRKTGRQLWEKGFTEREGMNGKLDELQAENQRGLKEGINRVMDVLTPKISAHVAKQKL